jgi:transposase
MSSFALGKEDTTMGVEGDRIDMSQRERDRSRVLQDVKEGRFSQAKAAQLLKLSVRQVRRLQVRWRKQGDAILVHGLRGKPSNHQHTPALKKKVLQAYRQRYADFGPTLACEKLALEGLQIAVNTLRRWLLDEGLWQRRRRRERHRRRRPRRSCFGELVQIDTSLHDWTEGRGDDMVLITMIDDATSLVLARFYPADTTEAHMDLLGRWLQKYGRPRALYSDRHGIFEAHKKGEIDYEGETQFSRALAELDIDLIKAHSPQAKGRVERSFGTAQDRWVKEMRLAKVKTIDEANEVLERLLPDHNRRFNVPAADAGDAHRALGSGHRLDAILSHQETRVVNNDYTIRFENRLYQLEKPIYAGERGGNVIIELRLDGTMAIRFGNRYLNYHDIATRPTAVAVSTEPSATAAGNSCTGLAGPGLDRDKPRKINKDEASTKEASPSGVKPTNGRSGRTPAEPYPPAGEDKARTPGPYRPAADHPWRRGFHGRTGKN